MNNLENMMRYFLLEGAGDKKDHLVEWKKTRLTRTMVVWVWAIWGLGNIALLEKWL